MSTLYLIPTPLTESGIHTLPEYVLAKVRSLTYFVAERAKTARAFIKECNHPLPIAELEIRELDKHAKVQEWNYLLEGLQKGNDVGFVSEAGCPGIADPGASAVSWAYKNNYSVVPLVGPTSIILSLMASGLNGQNFCFNGYLPNKPNELKSKFKRLESTILKTGQTQIFIETPYRNQAIVKEILSSINPNIKLCIGRDLSGSKEKIVTKTIAQWKKSSLPELHKIPCIFLLGR